MSTQFEKLIAKHELDRRRYLAVEDETRRIKNLPTHELERIVAEPTDVQHPQTTEDKGEK